MGVQANVSLHAFPKQGNFLHKKVRVAFHRNFKEAVGGEVVRCDTEEPWIMIIKLDDGRYVLDAECQYTDY